ARSLLYYYIQSVKERNVFPHILFAPAIPTDYFFMTEKGCKDMLFLPYAPNILEEKIQSFFLPGAIC
ncbi:MAG TPA: hypothetical protein PLY63_01760, partial [Bacteroidales bacterium]|nr:hypothetical protein [Bacteroidales bacterium]HQB71379.1 hypothetical protein [Bacteroidales bacterium]HQP22039.1 hypothetical protein [Bacteroidales bacterium]